ncbi:MAG: maleylpyruvate isomerase N-terminal domain-containing protein [Anaerolineae bacterium]|nr:maleylpyruvate isomerase N-terminal domain-containing protein [Anaerolineae bacterium]
MSEEVLPPTKTDLLARMAQARAALEQALGQLSEAQLTRPGPAGGWAIKDHLAHLAAWERGIAALLQRRPRWPAMGLDEAAISTYDEAGINDLIYQQHKDRSLAEVLADFHEAHRQMLAALDGLSDAELFKPYAYYTGEAAGDDMRPIIGWIIGNTYEHYAEHQAWIEAML